MWPIGRAAGRVLKNHPDLVNYSVKWKVTDLPGGAVAQLPESFFTVVAQLSDFNFRPRVGAFGWTHRCSRICNMPSRLHPR